jgi:hypothetical protein
MGEGKQELLVTAQGYEQTRDHAHAQEQSFAYSQALLQIAIVLSSVAIVASSRWLLYGGFALGAIALLLMLNGYLLLVHLPSL